ncbi:MAG: DUF4157 domain-containing protein [Ignisphaera sp.]
MSRAPLLLFAVVLAAIVVAVLVQYIYIVFVKQESAVPLTKTRTVTYVTTVVTTPIYTNPVTSITSTSSRYELILSLARDVENVVERIRNLSFNGGVNFELINTSWALEHWAPSESSEVPPDVLYKEMVYKLTFLTPLNFSLISGERGFIGMFLAATAGTTIYINTDYFDPNSPGSRNVLAHELTHVLQFIHFPNIFSGDNTTDSGLAKQALIEGDAGWTQHLYCVITGLCTPSPRTGIDLGNPYIALVTFPYVYGEWFISYLYNLSGWGIVNKAYSMPPISTSMVMHPDRYVVYLSTGEKGFEDPIIACNCSGSKVYSDRLGEYYVMLVLARRMGLDNAMEIASSWGGDRVVLYKIENVTHVTWTLCWNITWRSQQSLDKFYEVFSNAVKPLGGEYNNNTLMVEIYRGDSWTFIKSVYITVKR